MPLLSRCRAWWPHLSRSHASAELAVTALRRIQAVRSARGWVPSASASAAQARGAQGSGHTGTPDSREVDVLADDDSTDDSTMRGAGPAAARDRLPPALRGARWELVPRAVVGLAALGLLAAALGGGYLWRARSADVGVVAPQTTRATSTAPAGPLPADVLESSGGTRASAPAATARPPSPTRGPGAPLLVHVVGQVRHPGLVQLPAGARVGDAVAAAGGPNPAADLSAVNLARPVADGEQVLVPAPGDPPASPAPAGPAGLPSGSPGQAGSGTEPLVDLNAATSEQLESLPGVGPILAGRILAWRTEHGGFRSVEELQEVSGIGQRTFAEIAPRVRV